MLEGLALQPVLKHIWPNFGQFKISDKTPFDFSEVKGLNSLKEVWNH